MIRRPPRSTLFPSPTLFLAFTTPLLLAALAADTPGERLGRTMGAFAAVQTAGIVSAPLVGGVAGHADLRPAFLIPRSEQHTAELQSRQSLVCPPLSQKNRMP